MTSSSEDSTSPYAGLAAKIRGGKSAAQTEYEQTPPKLKITHRESGQGFGRGLTRALSIAASALVSSALRVELNGVIVGAVAAGESLEIEIESGSHRLRILSSMCSNTKHFEITNGQQLKFWCLTTMTGVVLQREH